MQNNNASPGNFGNAFVFLLLFFLEKSESYAKLMFVVGKSSSHYPNTRTEEVNRKLEEFSRAKLVITDRLHGMIFSIITPMVLILKLELHKFYMNSYMLKLLNA